MALESLFNLASLLILSFLPGYFLLRLLYKQLRQFEYISLGLALGILALPVASLSIAWMFQTVITKWIVFSISAVTTFVCIIVIKSNNLQKPARLKLSKGEILLSVILIFVFLFFLMNFEGPTKDYWDTYIVAPAMFLTNQPINFTSMDGVQLYNYQLAGKIPQNLVDANSYGIITQDQRLGSGVIFSVPFLFLGIFGFRFLNALIIALTFLILYLTGKKMFKKEFLCLLLAVIVIFNPYFISINRLNPNVIALFAMSVLIFFMLHEEKNYFILGLLYGILGSIRYEAVIFIPAVLFILYKTEKRHFVRNTAIFAASALIAILPFLLWNKFAFSGFLVHPTQSPLLAGFRPVFPHTFFGIKFNFNGLLNYPFYMGLIRTPHFPYPVFLMLPLVIAKSFGLLLFSLMFFGVFYLTKQNRNASLFFLIWIITLFLFLAPQENWDEFKMTYILLMLPIIAIFAIKGIETFIYKISFRKILVLILILILLVSSINIMSNLNFPADGRWYKRFPHAIISENQTNYLNDSQRMSWEFFHTAENYDEIAYQRAKITKTSLLPAFYIKRHGDFFDSALKIPQEIGKKNLTAVAIWEYVYG